MQDAKSLIARGIAVLLVLVGIYSLYLIFTIRPSDELGALGTVLFAIFIGVPSLIAGVGFWLFRNWALKGLRIVTGIFIVFLVSMGLTYNGHLVLTNVLILIPFIILFVYTFLPSTKVLFTQIYN